MRRAVCTALVASLACSASVAAQMGPDERPPSLMLGIAAEATRQAAAQASPEAMKPPPGWQAVRLIEPDTEVWVVLTGNGSRRYRFVSATDDELILRDSRMARAERYDRKEVLRVSALRTAHWRSGMFAAGGAALGFLGGVASFSALAFKPCGRSCGDEHLLIVSSLFGLPVAGGGLGWKLSARQTWSVIYERRV